MSELLSCPFCGSRNVAQGASSDRISVWCDCGARGPDVAFPLDCIDPVTPIKECHALWNRRTDATAISERDRRIEELEAYAREATKAITNLTIGGSEYFGKRIGKIYTADLPYCVDHIRKRMGYHHEQLKAEMRAEKAEAALSASRAECEGLRAALRKARHLVDIATDWNLDEVEIDGEMVRTYSLGAEFDAALASISQPAKGEGEGGE